jgi:hypothetical protein
MPEHPASDAFIKNLLATGHKLGIASSYHFSLKLRFRREDFGEFIPQTIAIVLRRRLHPLQIKRAMSRV